MSVHQPSPRIPSYRLHRQSGQAVVTLPDGFGGRRDVLLGKHGTQASKNEYRRVVLEWQANDHRLNRQGPADLSIGEVIERYWHHAQKYYRRADGSQTKEVACIMYALRPLNFLHGKTLAKDFGPAMLKAVRELMVRGYTHSKFGEQAALCRGEVNKRVKTIRRAMKWAVENELIPAEVLTGLQAVAALKRGRTDAAESPGVKVVPRAVVESTLPLLRPTMQGMVLLQLETGMRPGEMVAVRGCDIDTTGDTWIYRPPQHKTLHHGHQRNIALGPKAMDIVRRHLSTDALAPLFSPLKLMEERRNAMRASRRSKVQPSQANRAKAKRKRPPGNQYTVQSYDRAIANAIERHNKGKPESEHIPHWAPNQLRHLRAAELRRQFGLDVTRAVLGHSQPNQTEHYAGVDTQAASEAMGKVG